jgi:hypothetical protein
VPPSQFAASFPGFLPQGRHLTKIKASLLPPRWYQIDRLKKKIRCSSLNRDHTYKRQGLSGLPEPQNRRNFGYRSLVDVE